MISYNILSLIPTKINSKILSKYRMELYKNINSIKITYCKRSKLRKLQNIIVENYIQSIEETHYQTIMFNVDEKDLILFMQHIKPLWNNIFYLKFICNDDQKFLYVLNKKQMYYRINPCIKNKIYDIKNVNLFMVYNLLFNQQYSLFHKFINLFKYLEDKFKN